MHSDYFGYASLADARKICEDQGLTLPLPKSSEDNEELRVKLRNLDIDSSWLDIESPTAVLSWTNWRSGQPSGDGKGVHMVVNRKWGSNWNGQWNDESVNSKIGYICVKRGK